MPAPTHAPLEVAVVGAGIVGLSCAAYLARDGHRVSVFDPLPPGEGCSLGNAGILGLSRAMPLGHPGLLPHLPRMLLDPLSPLRLKLRYLPRLLPWLARFAASSRASRVEALSCALHSLLAHALAAHEELAREAGTSSLICKSGWLYAYEHERTLDEDQVEQNLRSRRGIRFEILSGEAVRQLEPALGPQIRCGLFLPDDGHIADPLALSRALAAAILRRGGTIRRAAVRTIERDGSRWRLDTDAHDWRGERLVIAAGARSRPLTERLGLRVPLEAERGYHLTLPNPGIALRRPVLHGEGRFAVTPMAMGLRLAGTSEFAGQDAPPDWSRADILGVEAARLFPGLSLAGATQWSGERPATPDSLPLIGPVAAAQGAYVAFGHGHLGLTLGPITGRLIADLIAERTPPVPLAPFAAERFAFPVRRLDQARKGRTSVWTRPIP